MVPKEGREKLIVVTPVFNDWIAFGRLIEEFDASRESLPSEIYLIAIDDGSSETPEVELFSGRKGPFTDIRIVRLACNLGHQRAIAVGLVIAEQIGDSGAVVVMDSDGEDRPSDIGSLYAAWKDNPKHVIVAKRGLRTEGRIFRFCYSIYKFAFKSLTGVTIDFGNFCLLPMSTLHALTHNPATWNNLAAAVSRSRIPIIKREINRGKRLGGSSRMSFTGLVIHGLSAISVYADVALVRVVTTAGICAGLALAGVVLVVLIRLLTELAIPGWASYAAASFIIIFFQAVILGGLAMFQLLSFRSMKPFVPAIDAGAFILGEFRNTTRDETPLTQHVS